MEDLKPCPFCNEQISDLEFQHGTPDREGTPINVFCGFCGAAGPWSYTDNIENTQQAVRDWNKRA